METVRGYAEKYRRQGRQLEQTVEDSEVCTNIDQICGTVNDAVCVAGLELSEESINESNTLAEAFESEAEFLEWLIKEVRAQTGVDVGNVKFAQLPAGVAGRYHLKSQTIELDESLRGNRAEMFHVAIHEALHASIRSKCAGIQLDEKCEEGVVETLATQKKAEVMGDRTRLAYHEEGRYAANVCRMADVTQAEVERCVLNGEAQRLNEIFETGKQKLEGQ